MPNGDDKDDGVEFFQLPREMRDAAYANLTKDIKLISGILDDEVRRGIQVYVKNGPIPAAMLVSKQFREEYEKQTKPVRALVFKDLGGSLIAPCSTFLKIDTRSSFKKVEFELLALCTPVVPQPCTQDWCPVAEDALQHSVWTKKALEHLPAVEEVVMRLYIHWKGEGEPKWPECGHTPRIHESIDQLVQVKGLSKLEVYPFYWNTDRDYNDLAARASIYEEHEGMVALWTKEVGWGEV